MPEDRYPCPCCGYQTYILPAGGSWQLCPVCFWEDSLGDPRYSGSNEVSLIEAQGNFINFGAAERKYRSAVRPPLPEEAKPSGWLSFPEMKMKVISLIEEVFKDVRRDGGVTLHQMDVLDDYGSEFELKEAGLKDTETTWQEIPSGKLSTFQLSMTFLDAKGFRFYLPAFMRHALLTLGSDRGSEGDGVIFSLCRGPDDDFRKEDFRLLGAREKECIAAFLHVLAIADPDGSSDARRGLKNGWNRRLLDFLKLGWA